MIIKTTVDIWFIEISAYPSVQNFINDLSNTSEISSLFQQLLPVP